MTVRTAAGSDQRGRPRSNIQQAPALTALPSDQFAAAYEELLNRLGFDGTRRVTLRPELRILSSRQIRPMALNALLRFGAHTSTHQILTRMSKERAVLEIEKSIGAAAGLVERPSSSFAYPNGGLNDFDANSIDTLRRLDIRYGLTTVRGPNHGGTDPYCIHRYLSRQRSPWPDSPSWFTTRGRLSAE